MRESTRTASFKHFNYSFLCNYTPIYSVLHRPNSKLTWEASKPVSGFLAKWFKSFERCSLSMRLSELNPLLSLHPTSGDHDLRKLKFNPPGELHVSVFPIVWYKREKKIIKYFLCIYSLQNLTSLWPYSTSKNHILKKGNLESSQPRKVSKQSPAVLIRWFIKDLI